ncbi:hypothetical protein [Desulfoluna spongiiphila]|uniref:Uncharacterized protein n=1 Tax=Desulfoluna spongiiphila TaxID=419481 RepID=A0A1G5IVN5_9BACT|nr:hypothetical protein [Desulfoluna spongiiphila]SCY79679.1 hypothetical protein SAMN05216233_12231 [Desulfoluna spongiiphila]VVS93355.1 hypothetical protein DBB_29230 [Desulfoluna spongiiphila]
MTAIVISGGESERVRTLVEDLERETGSVAMGDDELIGMAAEGGGGSLALSWALFGAHPLADRMVNERKCARARMCRAMATALERGVRIFYGDLGHLLQRFPVAVFRVLFADARGDGDRGWARRRRRLFGRSFLDHTFYDMYLPCGLSPAGEEARAILERTAVAMGDPGRPLSVDRLRLAADMAEAELDLVRRGVDVEFWNHGNGLTLWNQSPLDNGELEDRVRRNYALGAISCRRGAPPSLFEARVPYLLSMRVEGDRGLAEMTEAVAGRNGGRMASTKHEVVIYGGLGWGGRLLVDLPDSLTDPEEVVWRLMALHPGRRLVLPASRYAWLVARMGLDTGARR